MVDSIPPRGIRQEQTKTPRFERGVLSNLDLFPDRGWKVGGSRDFFSPDTRFADVVGMARISSKACRFHRLPQAIVSSRLQIIP